MTWWLGRLVSHSPIAIRTKFSMRVLGGTHSNNGRDKAETPTLEVAPESPGEGVSKRKP